jgi:pyridoxal phosphate enzyme (YggS family)
MEMTGLLIISLLIIMINMNDLSEYGTLATRVAAVQQAIIAARGHRPSVSRLIAASKGQPTAMLEAAMALGITEFGENRVQEAAEKWPALKAKCHFVRLHLIGPLQSNKVAEAVALFDVIQTIDREKIAAAVAGEMARRGKKLECLVQVNIGEESQKSGVLPCDLPNLLRYCEAVGLPIVGLMAVPPADANPAPYFALLAKLGKRHGLAELSMGMSHDYTTAIRLGATYVRIGTALFGKRMHIAGMTTGERTNA